MGLREVLVIWPIARTQYTKLYLSPGKSLSTSKSASPEETKVLDPALGKLDNSQLVQFTSTTFDSETGITGHVVAHLNVSCSASSSSAESPSGIDIFVTLRHLDSAG